ncbi:MAG: hypothetical protein HQL59_10590 [Magnetococcales bacterium]|nr:hypothetical protein [Magnetococcales bacterium]
MTQVMFGGSVLLVAGLLLGGGMGGAMAAGEIVDIRDPIGLLESLEKRRVELDRRTERVALREAELQRLEEKLAKRIEALQGLRSSMKSDLAKEQDVDDENIARLAKIYGDMKPQAAADGLKLLSPETAVRVLKGMREKVAAKILSRMAPDVAARMADSLGTPMAERRSQQ